MSTRGKRRLRSSSPGEPSLGGWLAPIQAWAVAFALGVGLALCEADLLVPLFWDRRLHVQLSIVGIAALLQTPLLLGCMRGLVQERPFEGGPVTVLARWAIWLGLASALITLIWEASMGIQAVLQAPLQAVEAARRVVLDRGSVWTYLALLALLLALPRARPFLEALTAQQRVLLPLYFLAVGFAVVYLVNTLLPMLDLTAGRFVAPDVVPTYDPVGMDFRRGMYLPATRLLSGLNIYPADAAKSPNLYPPLVTLLGTVFIWLPENSALVLHALLLFAANIACLLMAIALWRRARGPSKSEDATPQGLTELTLLVLVGVTVFSGYPFLFSFERGNSDALAMLLAAAAYVVLAARPERIWWQIVLLSLAIHIKAYPALLLLPLFLVHRRRMLLPTLLVNVALLLCLGPANAIGFILSLLRFYAPGVWISNHSAYSFAGLLSPIVGAAGGAEWVLRAALVALPVIVWGFGLAALRHHNRAGGLAAAAFVLTAPVMAVLPGISYDYQLVIVYAPILLLLAMVVESMQERQAPADYVLLLLVLLAVGFIGRSYLGMPGVSAMIQNKYAWLILLQLAALAQILQVVGEPKAGAAMRGGRRASVGG